MKWLIFFIFLIVLPFTQAVYIEKGVIFSTNNKANVSLNFTANHILVGSNFIKIDNFTFTHLNVSDYEFFYNYTPLNLVYNISGNINNLSISGFKPLYPDFINVEKNSILINQFVLNKTNLFSKGKYRFYNSNITAMLFEKVITEWMAYVGIPTKSLIANMTTKKFIFIGKFNSKNMTGATKRYACWDTNGDLIGQNTPCI